MPSEENRLRPAEYQPTIFLIRGAPGSGKSRLAWIVAPAACYSADDYFEHLAVKNATTYEKVWSANKLEEAHDLCFDRAKGAMSARCSRIAIHNTFTTLKELERYQDLARTNGYVCNVIRMENDFGNVHGVPRGKVVEMRDRMEKC